MKGVLLAGGTGSRMYPLTHVTNKHLLPVGRKPMIYYPLSCLVNAGIEDICIVTGGEHFDAIARLLGSGKDLSKLGINRPVNLAYRVQDRAGGIAEALGLAQIVAHDDSVAVVLGDNIYEDQNFLCKPVRRFSHGAHIFLKNVPRKHLFEEKNYLLFRRAKYGMAEFDHNRVIGIQEKPVRPKTNYAVTGAYLYDNTVFDIVKTLKPSSDRGELEITDVNNAYIKRKAMRFSVVDGFWTDAGSPDSHHLANELVWKMQEQK